MPEQVDRLHAIFSGEVQGVGFRYTTRRLAASYPEITGMVRNLPDGTVELLAEGERETIERFLADIRSAMHTYIAECTAQWKLGSRQYPSFGVGF